MHAGQCVYVTEWWEQISRTISSKSHVALIRELLPDGKVLTMAVALDHSQLTSVPTIIRSCYNTSIIPLRRSIPHHTAFIKMLDFNILIILR